VTETELSGSKTVLERPRRHASSSPSLDVSVALVTPVQALTHFEAHRVRSFMIGTTFASIVTGVLVLLLDGDPFGARVHAYTLFGSAVMTAAYSIVYRDPSATTRRSRRRHGLTCS
jgi:hypothetical protein